MAPPPPTYPLYTGPTHTPYPIIDPAVSTLLPLFQPPAQQAPAYPPRPALPVAVPAGWTRTVHAAPAAYPRSGENAVGNLVRESKPFSSNLPIPADKANDKAFKAAVYTNEANNVTRAHYLDHILTADEAAASTQPHLWLGVERWTRDKPTGGITLIVTQANGLIKEVGGRVDGCLGFCRSLTRPSNGPRRSSRSSSVAPAPPAPSLALACPSGTTHACSSTTCGSSTQ